MSDENETDFLEFLILSGAVEVGGINAETGEFLYIFTEKIVDIFPELFEEHKNDVKTKIMELWSEGFVSITFDENDHMKVMITEKAFDDNEVAKLSKDYRFAIEEIKRISRLD